MTASDMKDLLDALYDSFSSGDVSAWEEHLGDDAVCVGTDEDEWWQGRDAVLPALKAQLEEMSDAGLWISPGDPVITNKGGLVLVADRPILHLPDGSSTVLHLTLVASRMEGSLTIEQVHLSVPGPNEDVVEQTLAV